MQDTITKFTWLDKDGNRKSTTTVGSQETKDQWGYLAVLSAAGTVSEVDYKIVGQDI